LPICDPAKSPAALGHESQNTSSPEGAKVGGIVALGELSEARISQDGPSGHGEFTYVDISSIDRQTKRIVDPKVLVVGQAPSRARQVLKGGDVLVSMTRPNLNAVALVPPDLDGAIGSTGFHVLRPKDAEPGFLYYAVQTTDFIDAMCQKVQGALYPAVRPKDISSFCILPSSLPQQRRIVAEIEKQFTRLEAGVAALRRVQANLKRYRAAVLKAACEGKLVPIEAELADVGRVPPRGVRPTAKNAASGDAAYNAAPYETGEQLLQRILTERRQNWQGRGQYKEPAAPDTASLPPLPDGWTWARLEQLGVTFGGLTKNPKRAKLPKQLPYLRVANVYANELRLQEIEHIGVEDSELEKLLVRAGDLLIVEGNGSKAQIGRLAMWDGSIDPCVHQNHIIKVRPVEARMPKWILHWLQSPIGRHFVELVASSTSGLYTLSVNKVGDLPVALPPLAEQTRIVAEVERRLSVVEELESVMSAKGASINNIYTSEC
jgi:type I restriction enzyme S subunit